MVSLICVGVVLANKDNMQAPASDTKFYDEYISYNGKEASNGKTYPKVTIAKNNLYYYASEDEIKELLDNGTGVLYLGFPTCPWCRNIVSVLNEAGIDYGIAKINYYNIKDIRSTITVNDNNELETKKGTDFYYQLLEKLDNYLEDYTITDKKDKTIKTGEKRLYAPTVIFVKNGEVVEFIEGTVDSQKDPYVALNENQRNELISKYQAGFNKLGDICDEKC